MQDMLLEFAENMCADFQRAKEREIEIDASVFLKILQKNLKDSDLRLIHYAKQQRDSTLSDA